MTWFIFLQRMKSINVKITSVKRQSENNYTDYYKGMLKLSVLPIKCDSFQYTIFLIVFTDLKILFPQLKYIRHKCNWGWPILCRKTIKKFRSVLPILNLIWHLQLSTCANIGFIQKCCNLYKTEIAISLD